MRDYGRVYKFIIEKRFVFNEYAKLFTPEEIGDTTNTTAMIKLYKFEGSAILDFYNCVKAFKDAGYKKLILDLRDNGGGEALILQYIASCLINGADSKNIEILKSIYNSGDGKMKTEYLGTTNQGEVVVDGETQIVPVLNLPKEIGDEFELVVLANGNSASCSEALLGALQYYNNVGFVGSKTYGKGVGQISMPFAGGKYILVITNSKYFIPTDEDGDGVIDWTKSIHKTGISPTEENQIDNIYRPIIRDEAIKRALTLFNS